MQKKNDRENVLVRANPSQSKRDSEVKTWRLKQSNQIFQSVLFNDINININMWWNIPHSTDFVWKASDAWLVHKLWDKLHFVFIFQFCIPSKKEKIRKKRRKNQNSHSQQHHISSVIRKLVRRLNAFFPIEFYCR